METGGLAKQIPEFQLPEAGKAEHRDLLGLKAQREIRAILDRLARLAPRANKESRGPKESRESKVYPANRAPRARLAQKETKATRETRGRKGNRDLLAPPAAALGVPAKRFIPQRRPGSAPGSTGNLSISEHGALGRHQKETPGPKPAS